MRKGLFVLLLLFIATVAQTQVLPGTYVTEFGDRWVLQPGRRAVINNLPQNFAWVTVWHYINTGSIPIRDRSQVQQMALFVLDGVYYVPQRIGPGMYMLQPVYERSLGIQEVRICLMYSVYEIAGPAFWIREIRQ